MESLPQKKNFRQRAHSNPFNDKNFTYPFNPTKMNWDDFFENKKLPTFLDIGCGYGNFLIKVSKMYPDENIVGLEIRAKVTEFVEQSIKALQNQNQIKKNITVIRTNALKFLPNFFLKESLKKIFILFPDPHFKKRKHKARIVCRQMVNQYAFFLEKGGSLYISTDVSDLFQHMLEEINTNRHFVRVDEEECCKDPLYKCTFSDTDESKRAGIKTGKTFAAIFKRL